MRIHPFVYGVLILTVFFGIVLGFQAAGVWSTTGKVTSDGRQVQPSTDNVDTIKGWMTLEQISTAYHVSIDEILTQFGLPTGTLPSTALKDLETDTFSVDDLRTWLDIKLQSKTVPVVSPDLVSPEAAPTQPAAAAPILSPTTAPKPEETRIEEFIVNGKTTFQDLLDWGVPQEAIQRIIGGPLPPLSTGIKEYATGQGMEFSSVKSQLQMEVERGT